MFEIVGVFPPPDPNSGDKSTCTPSARICKLSSLVSLGIVLVKSSLGWAVSSCCMAIVNPCCGELELGGFDGNDLATRVSLDRSDRKLNDRLGGL